MITLTLTEAQAELLRACLKGAKTELAANLANIPPDADAHAVTAAYLAAVEALAAEIQARAS